MKQLSQLDQDGYFIGVTTADPSPLEPGVFLIPSGAIDVVPPPSVPEGKRAKWEGQWVFEDIPQPEPDESERPLTQEEQERKNKSIRLEAYQFLSDPLFFKWQAGEATEEEWLAKRAEIRERFPYSSNLEKL